MKISQVYRLLFHVGGAFNFLDRDFLPDLAEIDKQYILDMTEVVKKAVGSKYGEITNDSILKKVFPGNLELKENAEMLHTKYLQWLETSKYPGLYRDIKNDPGVYA
ncbi:hypothetical protein HN784_00760 [bacterium]|jgi:hypothetical protein|nr:hypothetical protein [bacterium]MBT4251606.1 hypothetical protein [bacterium]MBT4597655.1 hypothetical protein [bacterium]MBT6753668.1 hypothetical protein [bacterium]MBT7037805.1 hypothetical protein [bacterium]